MSTPQDPKNPNGGFNQMSGQAEQIQGENNTPPDDATAQRKAEADAGKPAAVKGETAAGTAAAPAGANQSPPGTPAGTQDIPPNDKPPQLSPQNIAAPGTNDIEANKTESNPSGAAVATGGTTPDAMAGTGNVPGQINKPVATEVKGEPDDPNGPGVKTSPNNPSQTVVTKEPPVTGRVGSVEEREQLQDRQQAHQDALNQGAVASSNRAQGERAAQSGAEHNAAVERNQEKKLVNVTTRYRRDPAVLGEALEEAESLHGEGTKIIPEAYHDIRLPADAAQRRREAIARIAGAHPDTIPTPGRTRVPPNSGNEPEDQDTKPVPSTNPTGYTTNEEEVARAADKRHVAASQRRDKADAGEDVANTGTERADKPIK